MTNTLQQMARRYAKEIATRFGQRRAAAPGQAAQDVAAYWSKCANVLLGVVRDPIVANRGTWHHDDSVTACIPPELAEALGKSVRSAAMRTVGARLERGLQFRIHINRSLTESLILDTIDALSKSARSNSRRRKLDHSSTETSLSAALEYHPDLHPQLRRKQQARFRETILPEIRALLRNKERGKVLELFLELWTYAYSHFNDRDSVLGNELLRYRCHDTKSIVYHIDTRKDVESAEAPTSIATNGLETLLIPLLHRADAHLFTSQYVCGLRRRIVCAIMTALYHIKQRERLWKACTEQQFDEYSEIIRHMGQRTLAAFRFPRSIHEPWAGVAHGIGQLEDLARNQLSEERTQLWSAMNPAFTGASKSDKYNEKCKWIHLLHQFLLYHGMHGKCFYFFIAPPTTKSGIRTSFTVGTERPLESDELESLIIVHRAVIQLINQFVLEKDITYDKPFQRLPTIVGSTAAKELDSRIAHLTGRNYAANDRVLGGLPHYLAFAERLAEVAKHEGKALRFDILVADGVRRYEHLETIASLEGKNDRDESWVTLEAQSEFNQVSLTHDAKRPTVNESLAARILGNFAFLQRDRVYLLGNRSGRLRALTRTLLPLSPEQLTRMEERVKGMAKEDERGCYLVRLLVNGEIQVFHRGQLILWRRLSNYIVVKKNQYGESYRSELVKHLRHFVQASEIEEDENHKAILDLDILGDVIWEIAETDGLGACFVLAEFDSEQGRPFLRDHAIELSSVLPHAEGLPLVWAYQRDVLRDLAVQDGATIIDIRSGLVFGRRLLTPGVPSANTMRCIDESARESPEILHWGSRHLSSLRLVIEAHKAKAALLAVTVSSDGDIHVFEKGGVVTGLTYPPGLTQSTILKKGTKKKSEVSTKSARTEGEMRPSKRGNSTASVSGRTGK